MSGVEVAGLILGALPLMITALEHYRESAEVLEGWWKIKTEYRKCKAHLNFHKTAFEQNLEELLLPLIADEEKLKMLLDHPGGPEWKDPELESALKNRMPKTYSSYLDTIDMMVNIIRDLDDTLGTNKVQFQQRLGNGNSQDNYSTQYTEKGLLFDVTLRGLANLEYQTQRIKLAFNKTVTEQLFTDFGSYNSRLREILGSSDRLAELRSARQMTNKQAAINSGLSKFWNHASSVFELLTEAWTCQCQTFHHANLLLQHRISTAVNFNIAFWYKLHLDGQLPWTWQDTNIKLVEEGGSGASLHVPQLPCIHIPATPKPLSIPKIVLPSLPPQSQPPILATVTTAAVVTATSTALPKNSHHHFHSYAKEMKKTKTVHKSTRSSFLDKFMHRNSKAEDNGGKKINGTVTVVAAPPPVTAANQPLPAPKPKVSFAEPTKLPPMVDTTKVTDLCSTIEACPSDLPEYGCLKGSVFQYMIQPLSAGNTQPQKSLTLEHLLSKQRTVDLSRRQRYHIALILASSHIQLHRSPWLSKWGKRDIFFLYDEGQSTICLDQPYISRSLCRTLHKKANKSVVESDMFLESIRTLGIILVELCFGTAIEDYKGRILYSGTDEKMLQIIDYDAADKLSRLVVEEAGLEYSDAVTWCLHRGNEGKEDKWREDMFRKVVDPLIYCHEQLSKLNV